MELRCSMHTPVDHQRSAGRCMPPRALPCHNAGQRRALTTVHCWVRVLLFSPCCRSSIGVPEGCRTVSKGRTEVRPAPLALEYCHIRPDAQPLGPCPTSSLGPGREDSCFTLSPQPPSRDDSSPGGGTRNSPRQQGELLPGLPSPPQP